MRRGLKCYNAVYRLFYGVFLKTLMGPRKRSKLNPKPETSIVASKDQDENGPSPEQRSHPADVSEQTKETYHEGSNTHRSAKSWYGGTWPRGNKATPVTQVAKESISAAAGVASEIVATARAHTPPLPPAPVKSPPAFKRLDSPSTSSPLAATTTKLNIISNAPNPAKENTKGKKGQDKDYTAASEKEQANASTNAVPQSAITIQESSKGASQSNDAIVTHAESQKVQESDSFGESTGWLAWFSRPELAKGVRISARNSESKLLENDENRADKPTNTAYKSELPEGPPSTQHCNPEPNTSSVGSGQNVSRSWLHLWGNAQAKLDGEAIVAENVENASSKPKDSVEQGKTANPTNEDVHLNESQQYQGSREQAKSSGWAFWSRDTGNQKLSDSSGELALAGAPSQTRPEKDTLDDSQGVPKKVGNQRGPQLLESIGNADKLGEARGEEKKTDPADALDTSSKEKINRSLKQKLRGEPTNLLLPTFQSTYTSASKPGVLQQLNRWLPFTSQYHQPKHLNMLTNPPRIKRALAIGVHGFFPAPLVRSFLGQPTGTSIRFANSAATAIQKWTQAQGYSCEIEKVALEGEGKIAERIDLLWKLLLNWIDKISKSDFVFVACHSQGCPVAMILVAKLISFGCVSSARIGVCAMAGINLGPFTDYKSRWIGGTVLELFDFARQDSTVSRDYESALGIALKFGVKIVYVGSIDDQLVSLEVDSGAQFSSLCSADLIC